MLDKMTVSTRNYLLRGITSEEISYLQKYSRLNGPSRKMNKQLKKKLKSGNSWLIYEVPASDLDVYREDARVVLEDGVLGNLLRELRDPILLWAIWKIPDKSKRVLCLGCNIGIEIDVMSRMSKGSTIIGIDINLDFLKTPLGNGFTSVEGDIFHLPFKDGSFDCVFAKCIFEHIYNNPSRVLSEARRVLAPGGYLVAYLPREASNTHPYSNSLVSIIQEGRDMAVVDLGHPWKTDLYDIQYRLNQVGFKKPKFFLLDNGIRNETYRKLDLNAEIQRNSINKNLLREFQCLFERFWRRFIVEESKIVFLMLLPGIAPHYLISTRRMMKKSNAIHNNVSHVLVLVEKKETV